jgi:hypothetical protein
LEKEVGGSGRSGRPREKEGRGERGEGRGGKEGRGGCKKVEESGWEGEKKSSPQRDISKYSL